MKRVVGVGGVFFKARDPEALRAWYQRHLGFPLEPWGGAVFRWQTPERPEPDGATVWSLFDADATYFAPSSAPFMINYRVADLTALLAALRAEGCDVDERTEVSEQGSFGWVMDPEGNRVELWEPPAGDG
ncbi:MAG: glyoxalase [Deltaproteobacteria bacterium HGW-Deltaproteobacteria-14]|jgi:catechol 2,3-dioxygenase-like lactoylglutathione lyase family enzyme|nr:MAG: glyoxalase [Deltaproteobacteria bacterium HGW-Deltaproteobacteria-14]